MKTLFIFLSVSILEVTFLPCEGQIWPAPANPNFLWSGSRNDRDFYNDGDFPPHPPRNDGRSINQNNFRNDFNSGNSINQNNRRRTTTGALGPITSTPRTIHFAPERCNCPMTQQFNPVCGTDGNTYRNMGLLNCYRRCGTNVSQKRLGSC